MRQTLAEHIMSVKARSDAYDLVPTTELVALSDRFERSGGSVLFAGTQPLGGHTKVFNIAVAFPETRPLEATVALGIPSDNGVYCLGN